MSEDNGFVERPSVVHPKARRGLDSVVGRLRATADNGKAIVTPTPAGYYAALLKGQGYRTHQRKQPDGMYLCWCERISEPEGRRTP